MTENEAIKKLSHDNTAYGGACSEEVRKTAIKALEEVQQYRKHGITVESALDNMCDLAAAENLIEEYRAIGTVEELTHGKKYMRLAKRHGTIEQVVDKCAEYEAIGTPEQCRAAMEKQTEPLTVDKAKTIAAKAICIGCGYLVDCKCDYNGGNCMVSKPMLESVLKSFDDWNRRANDGTD